MKKIQKRPAGYMEKKEPDVREYTCPVCGCKLGRDVNSGVNITKKDKLLSGSDYVNWELSHVTYTAKWDFKKTKILFTGYVPEKPVA